MLRKGEVYIKKEAMTGYFMVVDYNKEEVKVSPLFWCEEITYQTIRREDLSLYKIHNENAGNPIVQARYDHELMRRRNKL